jgi:glutathione synthase/RimK-type ligase-like ATP-grasp enzyme
MNEVQILIITNSNDLHADIMETFLASKGVDFFRIDLDRFPKNYCLSFEVSENTRQALIKDKRSGKEADLFYSSAVWTRKSADYSFGCDDLSKQEKLFFEQETQHLLYSIIYSLDCFWINHPIAVQQARWKGEQSIRAINMGFKIPNSLISNDPVRARTFFTEQSCDVIIKTMSSPMLCADQVSEEDILLHGMQTTVLDDKMMDEIDAVEMCPAYFQNRIDKAYEIRVTVICDKVFAAKICSQDDDRTRVDYRDFSADINYEEITLPEIIQERCLAYVHSYGLQYGAIDLIVDPAGEYIFLENNPSGQFWFVEQLVPELRMMDYLGNCLINGGNNTNV